MSFIYLIPLVIFFVVLYLKKYKFEKNNFINIIFCGLLCELCSLLLSHFVFRIPKSYQYIFPILYYFFIAGIPEEISKYTMIKLSFPKDKKSIFVNSILISFIFMIIEDFGYSSLYDHLNPLVRLLTPGHLFFQLIMIFFLFKAFDAKEKNQRVKSFVFNILALIIPAVLHGIYDAYAAASTFIYLIIIGIFSFIFILVYLVKMDSSNMVIEKRKLSILSIIECILIVFITLLYVFAFSPSSKYNSLNTEVNIKESNITITIKDFKEVKVKPLSYEKTYTKIKIKIRNNADVDKTLDFFNFILRDGDKKILYDFSVLEEDVLPHIVPAHSFVEGYLYFEAKYKDSYYLTYLESNNLSNTKYFKIKK